MPGYTIAKVTGSNPVYIHVNYTRVVRCIYCNNKRLRKKDSFIRDIRHESIGVRYTYLRILASKYQRATENLRREVFYKHTEGVSQKDLSRHLNTGKSTIEHWHHYGYKRR